MSPLVPVIVGAVVDGIKSSLTKENLKSGTTKAAAVVAAGTGVNLGANPPQTIEEVVLNAVLAVTALILFFYRERQK